MSEQLENLRLAALPAVVCSAQQNSTAAFFLSQAPDVDASVDAFFSKVSSVSAATPQSRGVPQRRARRDCQGAPHACPRVPLRHCRAAARTQKAPTSRFPILGTKTPHVLPPSCVACTPCASRHARLVRRGMHALSYTPCARVCAASRPVTACVSVCRGRLTPPS